LFYSGLDQAIARLEQAHKQIVILIDLPEFPFLLRIPAMADSRSGHDGQPRSEAT
jgi:hypothetical protein